MVQAFKKDECIVGGVSYNKPGECGQAQQTLRDQQQLNMRGGARGNKASKQQIALHMRKLGGVINEILGSRKCFNKTSGTCNGSIIRKSVRELVEQKLLQNTVQVNVKKQKVMRHGATKAQVDDIINIIAGRSQGNRTRTRRVSPRPLGPNPYANVTTSTISSSPRTMRRSRSRSVMRMTPPPVPLRSFERSPPPVPPRSFKRTRKSPRKSMRKSPRKSMGKSPRKSMRKSPKKFDELSYVEAVHNLHLGKSPRKSIKKSGKRLSVREQLEKARKAANRPVTPGYEQLIGMMDKRQGMFPEGGGNKKRRRTRRKSLSKKQNSTRRRQYGGKQESVSHQAIANTTGDVKGAATAKGLEDLSAQVKYNNA